MAVAVTGSSVDDLMSFFGGRGGKGGMRPMGPIVPPHNYTSDEIYIYAIHSFTCINLVPCVVLLYMILSNVEQRKPSNFAIAGSMVAGTLLLIQNWCFQYYHAYDRKADDLLPCAMGSVAVGVYYIGSFLSLAYAGLDRYLAIIKADCHVKFSKMTNVSVAIVFIWLAAVVVCIPVWSSGEFGYDDAFMCNRQPLTPFRIGYKIAQVYIITMVGLGTAVFCVCKIASAMKTNEKGQEEVASEAYPDLKFTVNQEFKDIVSYIRTSCVLAVFFQLPLLIVLVIPAVQVTPWLGRGLLSLFVLEPTVKPFVVFRCMKIHREQTKYIVFCRKYKCDDPVQMRKIEQQAIDATFG